MIKDQTRILRVIRRNALHAVFHVGAGCYSREPYPETDAARHEIFFCLALHLSIWHWKIPGQPIYSCIVGNLASKLDSNYVLQGETIIILLQKYDIFGYTTDIDQLRDPQANSKQDSFSALFNLDYVAALRHINT